MNSASVFRYTDYLKLIEVVWDKNIAGRYTVHVDISYFDTLFGYLLRVGVILIRVIILSSFVQRPVIRDSSQIILHIAVQHQIGIPDWIIVEQIVQL